MGSQAASTSSVMPWSSRPAAAAVSITRAATSGSTCSRLAVARRSRTPSPPALSAGGRMGAPPVEEQLGASYELEGGTGRSPIDQGLTPLGGGQRGRPVEAAARAGVEGEAHRPGQPHVALVDVRQQPEGHEVGGGPGRPAPAAVGTGVGQVVEDRPRRTVQLLEQGADLVGRRARRQPEQVSRRRGRAGRGNPTPAPACALAPGPGPPRPGKPRAASGSLSWTIAWSTASSRASNPSSARSTEAFTTIRAASCEESCGAGVARSGRASSNADSCSSDQPRSWSARVRGAVSDIRRILRGRLRDARFVRASTSGDWQDRLHGGDRQVPGDAAGRCLPRGSRRGPRRGGGVRQRAGAAGRAARAARTGPPDPRADGAPAQPGGRADRALRDGAGPHGDP